MPFKVNETGLYVYVPHAEPPRYKCSVIVKFDDGERTLCQKPFWDARQYQTHVTRCAAEHIDEIRQARLSERLPAFYGPESGIPDVEAWLDREDPNGETNRAKAIEGRLKL